MRRRSLFRMAAVCAAVLCFGAARADTVNISGLTWGTGLGVTVNFGGGGPKAMATLPGGTKNFNAGGFSGTYTPSPPAPVSFFGTSLSDTFCVEIYQNIVTGPVGGYSVVDPTSTAYSAGGANGWGFDNVNTSKRIDELMSWAYAGVSSPTQSTALQLAIWNVIYDNDNDVTAGFFNVVDFSATTLNSAVALAANGFLTGSIGATVTRHYLVATNADSQDVLVIPTPGSLALAGLGLAGLAVTRRRRSVA